MLKQKAVVNINSNIAAATAAGQSQLAQGTGQGPVTTQTAAQSGACEDNC